MREGYETGTLFLCTNCGRRRIELTERTTCPTCNSAIRPMTENDFAIDAKKAGSWLRWFKGG